MLDAFQPDDKAVLDSWVADSKVNAATSQETRRSQKRRASESVEDDKKKDEMKTQKKKKAEDKKHAKWLSIGYHSLAVDDPSDTTFQSYASTDDDRDGTNIHFVIGDCTRPSTNLDEAYIILSYALKLLCLPQNFYWVHSQ